MPNGAQAMVTALEAEGVRTLFGYPGAAICPFLDALAASDITYHLVRHEQSAGHAASGYARVSGSPGVCFATSGPGATNLITALATAYMDSIPLVAITGQVQSGLIGRDVFQEADITGAAEPFCKHSYLVRDANDLPRVMKEAFYIARSGRPGPVLVDVPSDIQEQPVTSPAHHEKVDIRGYKPRTKGHALQIKRVAERVARAQKPVICAGGGIFSAHAQAVLAAFAEKCRIPVVNTLMGIGALPAAHPLAFGMLGTHGRAVANHALHNCDLLIIAGGRVGDRSVAEPDQIAARTCVVHIDVDPAEIGKNMDAELPLVGDLRLVLEALTEQTVPGDTAAWVASLESLRDAPEPARPPHSGCIEPRAFFRTLAAQMEDDAVVVADVGQSQIWAANHLAMRHGRFLTTGGMGTMGYSLPAAVGAAVALPERQIVAVCGDGAFHMSMMELATIRQYRLDIKLVVMHNDCLGMVHELQTKHYGGRYVATSLGCGDPDFQLLAKAYGLESRRVENDADVPDAVARMLHAPGPYLLECRIDPDEPTL
ncbi:biosynthetic-type acetolactate synthase large subunit [Ethanoligenens harbinense]|uniref:Acetolactate synthase n=1 Tax=Ethanoligenens harbinense (strain DSM 18485 / JCM 12961 / CGMCC 1.5033 / YUAN-3) TaxID=663278 RepID=E6U6N5_ETHHY|nr:biosynthetic-type acetolactate synthase large subunit [Ethanoligenens harbinense]ADU25768.1 acetolactate synthase, large subunit, biosynthetic type [Ethanoligenens harbinense YUAN-3]AVQ94938.1 acetolactate synthase, large subunit, biosynthetic type [Ethanoligenens harbinense YUAN-3]AYF37630.1 acetolactate synthase, large subunit, biosynthetic type [Ethanoligenens harbinense]AYF40350.1 acetolactate synthase, large subunit, biosynthetic type [Ethanoligenens harbinense]QCN91186.1 biosynthetic-